VAERVAAGTPNAGMAALVARHLDRFFKAEGVPRSRFEPHAVWKYPGRNCSLSIVGDGASARRALDETDYNPLRLLP
jgi:hypothetical protein